MASRLADRSLVVTSWRYLSRSSIFGKTAENFPLFRSSSLTDGSSGSRTSPTTFVEPMTLSLAIWPRSTRSRNWLYAIPLGPEEKIRNTNRAMSRDEVRINVLANSRPGRRGAGPPEAFGRPGGGVSGGVGSVKGGRLRTVRQYGRDTAGCPARCILLIPVLAHCLPVARVHCWGAAPVAPRPTWAGPARPWS